MPTPYLAVMEQLHGKAFLPFITKTRIVEAVARIGAQISIDYAGQDLLLVPVLNGSFIFAADLARAITIPCAFSFIKLASYEGTQSRGEIDEVIGLSDDVTSRHILFIEDIVDTGRTMAHLVSTLHTFSPASIHIATLLSKPDSFKEQVPIRYTGFEIGPEFVVGYGLDYDGQGRNFPEIYRISSSK